MQRGQQQHLTKMTAQAVAWLLALVEPHDLPAKRGELLQQRFLDVLLLVQLERRVIRNLGVDIAPYFY